jgi:hypothetical protein
MHERDWQLDWWDATNPDALDWPKPGTEKEWFEKWLQQRAVLQYWLRRVWELEKERDELRARVAKLEAVAKAAKPAAKALRFWLESDIMCECEGGIHNCGYTERVRELNELEQALAALEEA